MLDLSIGEITAQVEPMKTKEDPATLTVVQVRKHNIGYKLVIFAVHGGWSYWQNSGSCSVTCGGGVQKQIKTCTNPTPKYGGSQCYGNQPSRQIQCKYVIQNMYNPSP